MTAVNRRKKLLFTIVAVIAFVGVIFLWSVSIVFKTVDDAITGIFSGKHSDEDIVKYVKEKHGLDVRVIENTGPKHLKTGSDGVATVVTTDGSIEFSVFINSFGRISDDNYEYIIALPEIEQLINEDIEELTSTQFEEIMLLTDEYDQTLNLQLTLPDSIDYTDDTFIKRVDQAIKVFQQRNQQLKNDYNFHLEYMYITIAPDEGKILSTTDALLFNLEYEYDSVEDLQDELIERNHKRVMQLFVHEDLPKLEEVSEHLPELYQFEPISHNMDTPLDCLQFNGFSSCESYAVSIDLAEETDFDDFLNHRAVMISCMF